MTPEQALVVLKLSPGEMNSARSVRAAFARCVKTAHPDTCGASPVPTISTYQGARDVLLERIASQNNACKLCGGVGKVRAGMGWRSCSACDGTGDKG